MTSTIRPSPQTWTLRFKNSRSTVLLHVDPLQSLSSIRSELLKAIQQTCPSNTLNDHEIPTTADSILLARPVDANDLTLGWETLQKKDEGLTFKDQSKGKGKAAVSRVKGKDTLDDCPKGAGLRDGGVVAFKFKTQSLNNNDKEEDEGNLDGETLVDDSKNEEWDVVIPNGDETFDDAT